MGEHGREADRQMRRFPEGERRVVEAWRSASGRSLVYFLPDDRRARLEFGAQLAALTEDALASLFAASVPITATERRFATSTGRTWLAQATGPVWAESGSAAGATGIVFTSLEGPFERVVRDDVAPEWLEAVDRLPDLLGGEDGEAAPGAEEGE